MRGVSMKSAYSFWFKTEGPPPPKNQTGNESEPLEWEKTITSPYVTVPLGIVAGFCIAYIVMSIARGRKRKRTGAPGH
jgi:hypothetical protein